MIASVKIIDFNMRLTSEIYGTRYLEVEYARGNQSELFDHIHRKYEGCLLNTFKTYKSLEEMFGDISAFYSTPAFQKPMYAIIDESGAKLFFKLLLPASPAN
ncbi:MAG: hypothetical protein R3F41_04995 [Gammaproteobacteria bacterium]|nr:hypothetical protein [Pseudomonadales bacterium]